MTALAPTAISVQFAGVVETMRKHGWSGVMVGRAGIGKTCTAKAIAASTALTHLITASEALNAKPNLLWQMIAYELGVCGEESAADTQQRLYCHSFKGHVLFVDEAQALHAKWLREVLTLWDHCNLSVCFVGNPTVLTPKRQQGWDQFVSRLAIAHSLEGEDGDAERLAELYGVAQPEALRMLGSILEQHQARGVVFVLDAARNIAGERGAIDAPAIRRALQIVPKYRKATQS